MNNLPDELINIIISYLIDEKKHDVVHKTISVCMLKCVSKTFYNHVERYLTMFCSDKKIICCYLLNEVQKHNYHNILLWFKNNNYINEEIRMLETIDVVSYDVLKDYDLLYDIKKLYLFNNLPLLQLLYEKNIDVKLNYECTISFCVSLEMIMWIHEKYDLTNYKITYIANIDILKWLINKNIKFDNSCFNKMIYDNEIEMLEYCMSKNINIEINKRFIRTLKMIKFIKHNHLSIITKYWQFKVGCHYKNIDILNYLKNKNYFMVVNTDIIHILSLHNDSIIFEWLINNNILFEYTINNNIINNVLYNQHIQLLNFLKNDIVISQERIDKLFRIKCYKTLQWLHDNHYTINIPYEHVYNDVKCVEFLFNNNYKPIDNIETCLTKVYNRGDLKMLQWLLNHNYKITYNEKNIRTICNYGYVHILGFLKKNTSLQIPKNIVGPINDLKILNWLHKNGYCIEFSYEDIKRKLLYKNFKILNWYIKLNKNNLKLVRKCCFSCNVDSDVISWYNHNYATQTI